MTYFTLNCKNDTSKYGEISSDVYIEKKSKFYSYVFNIENKLQAQECIEKLKVDNKEARHIVYIYSYLENGKNIIQFSDDGEPQGTGTKAIYETIVKEQLSNICIVIVRYFGGILLGAGPLLRAYFNVAKSAINKCIKNEIYEYIKCEFECEYSNYEIIRNILSKHTYNRLVYFDKIDFDNVVKFSISIEKNNYKNIFESIVCYIKI